MSAPDIPETDYAAPFAWPADTHPGWTDFFRRWDEQVFAVCRSFRLQPTEADDTAQVVRTAVLRQHRTGATFDTNARFASFLRRTARGLCLNRLTRRRDTSELPSEIPDRPEQVGLDEFFDFIPDHVQPGQRVEWLIGQADEADRLVLTWKLLDGLGFAEIGKRLGVVASTAHDRFAAAQMKLRRRFSRAQ